MRGKKHPDEVRERALAALAVNNNVADVAVQVGLPEGTIKTWKLKNLDNDEFIELRQQKKAEFIQSSWRVIEKAMKLAERRVTTALEGEETLNSLIEEIQQDKEISEKTKQSVVSKLQDFKLQNIRDLSTFVGTLYDKQALASGEATNRVEATLTFEQMMRQVIDLDRE